MAQCSEARAAKSVTPEYHPAESADQATVAQCLDPIGLTLEDQMKSTAAQGKVLTRVRLPQKPNGK